MSMCPTKAGLAPMSSSLRQASTLTWTLAVRQYGFRTCGRRPTTRASLREAVPMEPEPFAYRDHARLVHEVDRRVALVENTAYVALVHEPSTTQRIVTVKKPARRAANTDHQE